MPTLYNILLKTYWSLSTADRKHFCMFASGEIIYIAEHTCLPVIRVNSCCVTVYTVVVLPPFCTVPSPIHIQKVKVQVYSLISSLKIYHSTLNLTPWSLDQLICVPFQLHREHTVLQPFRHIEIIVHIAISVLPGTHFHLSQVKHLRVKCLAQGHNILTMSQD